MAHNINFNEQTGKHSFFSVQEKAWHGLGQIVSDYPTSKEAIQYAGLDYRVEKMKMIVRDDEYFFNSPINSDIVIPELEIPNHYATVRTDTKAVLGVVGQDYQIVQNTEAFEFFDSIVGGGEGILYETAGALGNGETIFITAKLPGYIRVGNDDLIEKYLFLTTSHDGSGSITAAFTPIRIVCANTLRMAMANRTNTVKIRHTTNAASRLKEAHKLMGISNGMAEQMQDIFNHWAKTPITDKQVRRLIQLAMSPNRETTTLIQQGREEEISSRFANTVNSAFQYAMLNDTQQMDTTRGTLFGAYNAVTGFYQNVNDYKDNEAKVKSLYYGGTAQLRTHAAFSICEEFATHGKDALFLS